MQNTKAVLTGNWQPVTNKEKPYFHTNVKYLLLYVFLLFNFLANAQGQLSSIDSLYLNSIDHFYTNAENVKDKVWKNMSIGPVCLFRVNGPAILFNHPNPPEGFTRIKDKLYIGTQKEMELFGATQKEINGTLTAIANYGLMQYSDKEEFYAELFHELHHVYQRNFVSQIGFDNPATLLTYPENATNDALKLFEQKTLFNMCFENDAHEFRKLLNQFYSCRLAREQTIKTYIDYEKSVESMEGPAFYCEYKFYHHLSSANKALKDNYNHHHFFKFLTTPYYGRNNLRNRHLAAGMAMCLVLDKYFDGWQEEYYSKKISLYDFLVSKFNPQKEALKIDSMYDHLSNFHSLQEGLKHELSLGRFNAQPGVKITLNFDQKPQFKGFDPMHAESIDEHTILHKTMLRLTGSGDNALYVENKEAVTIIEGAIWFVNKVILFAPQESIQIKNNKIVVELEGQKLFWSGVLKTKNENEIIFNCE